MAPTKQADRNAQKRAAKKSVDEPEVASSDTGPGVLLELGKTLVLGSCIAKYAPKMPHILKADSPLSGDAKKATPARAKEEEKENEEKNEEITEEMKEETNEEEKVDGEDKPKNDAEPEEVVEIFGSLKSRLTWHNALGLAEPKSGADATTMWFAFKSLEMDWGPQKSKRGTPTLDRIVANLRGNFVQYLHILLFVFMLNAFLRRSWFACLPWLFFYQLASLMVPLETVAALPQVPLSQVPLKFRVAGTMGVHSLVWFFFLYEAIWKCGLFTEVLVFGLVAFHAHSAKPSSATN